MLSLLETSASQSAGLSSVLLRPRWSRLLRGEHSASLVPHRLTQAHRGQPTQVRQACAALEEPAQVGSPTPMRGVVGSSLSSFEADLPAVYVFDRSGLAEILR